MRARFDDDEPYFLKRRRTDSPRWPLDSHDIDFDLNTESGNPPLDGDTWSTWDDCLRGPEPYPDWVVTELTAVDTDLGVVKTGKEADVHLVRRAVPETDRVCLLAAKRYRDSNHRQFHRDSGYLEGRRVRRSRETRALANRTAFGRQLIAGQWAAAEFDALSTLWRIGQQMGAVAVPYPVQLRGTELMLEFVGSPGGDAAPRLAQLRPAGVELAELWRQLVDAMVMLARCGLGHGDLSPYNLLVHSGRLVLIDLPQVVDLVANPRGREFLARDVHVVSAWFVARGLSGVDEHALTRLLLAEANIR